MSYRNRRSVISIHAFKTCFFLVALIFVGLNLKAQFPNPSLFNTATNATGTGKLAYLAADLNWMAAMTNSLGTYTPAVVVGTQGGWSSSPYSNADWIVYPHTCSLTPADHSCNSLNIDEFYKLSFNLPSVNCGQSISTASAYCLSLDFMADNCVKEIFVNGISSYLSPVATPSTYGGFYLYNKVTVSLCNNWQSGTNTVIVHVNSGAFSYGGLTGFLAQANQTVNTSVGIPFSATAAHSNVTCYGSSNGSAVINPTGNTGPYTYTWQPAVSSGSIAGNLAAGSYSCVVQNANSCETIVTFTITQPPQLSISVSPIPATACVGNSVVLTANSSGGVPAYTYSWTAGPATSSYTVSQPMGAYVYTVSSRDFNNCLATKTVSLNFINTPALSASSPTICTATNVSIIAYGAASYTWNAGYVGNTFTAAPAITMVYTVTGTAVNGCTAATSASIVVKAVPQLSFVTASITCASLGSATVTAFNGTGPYSYSWNPSAQSSSVAINLSPGIYTLSVLDNGTGCTSASTATFTSLIPFTGTLSSTNSLVCNGANTGTASIALTGGSGNQSYTWSNPVGIQTTSTAAGLGAGIYTVTVTDNLTFCSFQQTFIITEPPAATVNVSASSASACLNNTVSLLGYGGVSYLWQGPNNLVSTRQDLNFTAGNLNMSGIYTLTVINANHCQASTKVSLTVYPLPTASLSSSKNNLCVPFCSEFSLKNDGLNIAPIKAFYFSDQPGYVLGSTLDRCIKTAGNLIVQVNYVDTNGCSNTASLVITAYPKPTANFDFSPQNPLEGSDEPVTFTNTSSDDAKEWNWFFTNNDGWSSKDKNAQHIYENAGVYPVALVATNHWSCADTIVKVIRVSEDFTFYVPNAFTPNGDDLNDIFQPKGTGITNYQLDIYDRWGERLFSSDNFLRGWDGTFKDKPCQVDAYNWFITLKDPKGKIRQYEGSVTIVE